MPIPILMPALSPTMVDGTLARWLKQAGDPVAAGDVIAEIETDKATMEVEAVDEGTMGKILVDEGAEGVPVNTPIALLLADGEAAAELEKFEAPAMAQQPTAQASKGSVTPPEAQATPDVPTRPAPAPAPAPVAKEGRIFASPLARRMAARQGIDLAQVAGSGPHGRVIKIDIENFQPGAAGRGPAVVTVTGEAPYELVAHTNMRKVIAERLTLSKQTVPHFYLTMDMEIDRLLDARRQINEGRGEGEVKISINDFVILAAGRALAQVPAANAGWTDDGLKRFSRADISVAVAIEGGLITPVVRGADLKSLAQISAEMKELGSRAHAGKLLPEDYQGGTFSISNMGMYGVREFAAVINPPQACILAVGAGEQRPVVRDGELELATVMSCTLSVDHRAVDGAIGAEFLGAFKNNIENPVTLLV